MEWVRDDAVYIVRRRSTNKPCRDSHWVYNSWSRWSNCLLLQEAFSLAEIVVWLCGTAKLLYSWYIEFAAVGRREDAVRIGLRAKSSAVLWQHLINIMLLCGPTTTKTLMMPLLFSFSVIHRNTNRHKYLRSLEFNPLLDYWIPYFMYTIESNQQQSRQQWKKKKKMSTTNTQIEFCGSNT